MVEHRVCRAEEGEPMTRQAANITMFVDQIMELAKNSGHDVDIVVSALSTALATIVQRAYREPVEHIRGMARTMEELVKQLEEFEQ